VVGLATVAVIVGVIALVATLFRGGFTESVPITLMSPRAGLVMNPDAKVQMLGVQVGKVASIEALPNGQAAIHLAMDPSRLHTIPADVAAEIASTTVFGAKQVQLVVPHDPSPESLRADQVLNTHHVMVEVNTVFEQLTSVLSKIEPAKLNETLGALAAAMNGRGQKIGQMLTDLDSFLAKLEPSLPALRHDLSVAPNVLRAYADAAPDFVSIADSATRISQTLADQQQNLDAALLSAIGLADIGNQVFTDNRRPLADVLRLLVPTTDLTNQYSPALYCGGAGLLPLAKNPVNKDPGAMVLAGFLLGQDRYRYPSDLPKVAAKGGPQCNLLPVVPYNTAPSWVVTDTGTNPWGRGNPGILVNSDLLKKLLYGPLDGPPRNGAQIGQPG
jgi:virulence factor Mce-like protein